MKTIPPFPKLSIGETATYQGHTLKRISHSLYESSHNPRLKYKRKELESILDPSPIGSKQWFLNRA